MWAPSLCSALLAADRLPTPTRPSTHPHTLSRSASLLLQHVSVRQPLFINRGVSFPPALLRPPVFQIKYLHFDVRRMEDVSSSFPYLNTNTVYYTYSSCITRQLKHSALQSYSTIFQVHNFTSVLFVRRKRDVLVLEQTCEQRLTII